jgi:hypothetical protein
VTVKLIGEDVPPPGAGFVTEIASEPAVARADAGMTALSDVAD